VSNQDTVQRHCLDALVSAQFHTVRVTCNNVWLKISSGWSCHSEVLGIPVLNRDLFSFPLENRKRLRIPRGKQLAKLHFRSFLCLASDPYE